MATSAFRLRVGALAAVAGLAFAGFAAASPAAADELPAPVIELDRTTFPAGTWEGGFRVTGTGFDGSVSTATLSMGARGAEGAGLVYETDVPVSADGTVDTVVVPNAATTVPDASGFPIYSVSAGQAVTDGAPWLWSNTVELTITAGAALAAPAQATPEQIAAEIRAQFTGFAPEETIEYGVGLFRDGELIASAEDVVTADGEGAGSFGATLADAQVGDTVQFSAHGEESDRIAAAYTQVVAAPAPTPETAAPAAPANTGGAALAETGFDLGFGGIAAAALLLLGMASVIIVRRRAAAGAR